MELSEFVKTTLVEIITGVEQAIVETASNRRAVINPTASHANHASPDQVKFDVALIVRGAVSDAEGRVSIRVAEIEMSAEEDSSPRRSASREAVSRVSFVIPVSWPSVPVTQYQR